MPRDYLINSATGNTIVTNTTISTNPNTGALRVLGGVGIVGNTYIGSTTASTSTTTGALVVSGGVGIGGNVYVGGNVNVGGNINAGGNVNAVSSLITGVTTINGITTITSATNSTSTTTGALVINNGGIGVSGNVNAGGNVNAVSSLITGSTASSSKTTGALVVTGGVGVSGSLNVGGNIKIDATTVSADKNTGALVVSGGVGVSGNVFCNSIHTTSQPYIFRKNVGGQALPYGGGRITFATEYVNTSSGLLSYDDTGYFTNVSGRTLLVSVSANASINANEGKTEVHICKNNTENTLGTGYFASTNSTLGNNQIRLATATNHFPAASTAPPFMASLSAITQLLNNERIYLTSWVPTTTSSTSTEAAYPTQIMIAIL